MPSALSYEKVSSQNSVKSDSRFGLYSDMASRFGTPFYLYDAEMLKRQANTLRSLLPADAKSRILYSFKSNPNPIVAGQLKNYGCRADLTSPGEIEAAREAGFDFGSALYGGPGKSEEELVFAISEGIRYFSIESIHDLSALREASVKSGQPVKALLRINPEEAPKAKLAMSGVASQFGFEEIDLHESGDEIMSKAGDSVSVVGIHIYWGTQIGEAEALMACFEKTVQIAEEISEKLGFPLEVLNLGGGFPWPYATKGEGSDLSSLKDGLARLQAGAGSAKSAEWWFESGRFLSASSGTLVARVMEVKKSKDREFLILDTGIHHLGGMSGLGRIPRFSIDLEVPPSRRSNEEMQVEVVGQLCTPLDCIGRRIKLPKVEPGDLVAVPNTGAYGPTASVLGFLSRPTPVEILHRGGDVISSNRLRGGHEMFQPNHHHPPHATR